MAGKAHHHSRRSRRRHVRAAVCSWLLAQLARVLTTVLLMVVARWLHLPIVGGE